MSKMINDLLLIAQADSGVLQIQKEPVEMDTLVLDVFRQAQKIAERQKGARCAGNSSGQRRSGAWSAEIGNACASCCSTGGQRHQVYAGRRHHHHRTQER